MAVGIAFRLRALATENLNLKLLSLAFALVLYSLVHTSQEAQRSFMVDVVTILPESSSRVLMTQIPDRVRVTVRGARSTVDELHADDLGSVQLNLQTGSEVRKPFQTTNVPPGLKVEEIVPPAVDLVWEDRIVRDVPVEVGIVGQAAPGFVVKGVPVATPGTVRATGPKSEVVVLQRARADAFDVTGLTEGKYTRELAIDRPRGRVAYDAAKVSATIEIGRETVERSFTKIPVAVTGQPKAKAQPAEVDVRLACPPEIVRALRPEQIVPRVQVTSNAEHGSDALPVELTFEPCEAQVVPKTVVVRW
jgi:YbbR domain-containing protein